MLLIRPAAAHRVTVFGSTRKSAATSPGVSRRSPTSTFASLLAGAKNRTMMRLVGAALLVRESFKHWRSGWRPETAKLI